MSRTIISYLGFDIEVREVSRVRDGVEEKGYSCRFVHGLPEGSEIMFYSEEKEYVYEDAQMALNDYYEFMEEG